MSGRGNLLSLFKKKEAPSNVSTSSAVHTCDSDRSLLSGEFRRVARDNVQNELANTLKNVNLSVGCGRAKLLESLKKSQTIDDPHAGGSNIIGGKKFNTKSVDADRDVASRHSTKSFNLFYPTCVKGSKGTPINLYCNYIKLKSDPSKGVYIYEVNFHPPIDSLHLRIKLLNEHRDEIGGTKTFDGNILYIPIMLENKLTTFVSKNVDNTDVEIRLLFKKKESLQNCINLYNILFDRVMKTLNYIRFARKQYDPTSPKIIPLAKLEVWPGYVTSVVECDGGLMLCCDVSHRLLCQKSVLEMLIEIYQHNKSSFQENAKKALLGNVVITRYNNRTYRIDDIHFHENPMSEFEGRSGSVTYMEYYKKHHNIIIKDVKQPLLLSFVKARSNEEPGKNIGFLLIPELCYLTGLRDEIRSDNKLMREIATFTKVSPNQRILALKKFCNNVLGNRDAREILEKWGLSLQESHSSVEGRRIDEQEIFFGKKSFSAGKRAEFSKYATKNELLKVIHLEHWLIIHVKNDIRVATGLLDNMERSAEALGMHINKPKIIVIDKDRVETYVDALRHNINKQHQIVICICPNSRDDRYAAIKKICCSEIPVPSQVVNARTLANENKNRSIVQKILLQMNCKMGGSLWTVKIPFKNVMICGFDSYHDPSQKGNSVAAFVASLNSSYSQWYSKAVIQSKREEIVNGLTALYEAALKSYKKYNGYLPDSVIIYRDGVGDGDLSLCTQYEIPQFETISSKIKITYIVIQKRINTRLILPVGTSVENPLPGTIVDKHITKARTYDFFLVPQFVQQGTVSPTHFVVLRDDTTYGPDIIQKLSYKLCFLYYNWPGTIRVPACCMYAHKMAYLIGQSIQRDTAESLANKLFYL